MTTRRGPLSQFAFRAQSHEVAQMRRQIESLQREKQAQAAQITRLRDALAKAVRKARRAERQAEAIASPAKTPEPAA